MKIIKPIAVNLKNYRNKINKLNFKKNYQSFRFLEGSLIKNITVIIPARFGSKRLKNKI